MKKLNNLVRILLFPAAVFAQQMDFQGNPLDPSVKTGKLPNGLTYYIKKMPNQKRK
jgi:zinc protease